MFEALKRMFGGKPPQDGLSVQTAKVLDCAAMNTANLLIDRFISERHGTQGSHWARGIESYVSAPGVQPNTIRRVAVQLPGGQHAAYYFNVARAAKVADLLVNNILDSIDWDAAESQATADDLPFDEGPGSFGESVESLIQQYLALSGDDMQRTSILFGRRADLFCATAPQSESAHLYTAIRSGAIESLRPTSLTDVVEKSALQRPMFMKDLLRLVARVEYGVRAGDDTYESINRYIDQRLQAHGIQAL